MRITFRCDPVLAPYIPKPIPARSALPDWLRTMRPTEFSPTHGQQVRTVKQCPPFIDAMTYGFIIPLPCDITVADGALSWNWDIPTPSVHAHPRSPISFHVPEQVKHTPLYHENQVLVKFNSFWTIELEPGWSLFATHPVNRPDLPFRLLTGLVDSDRFSDVGILFPAAWTDPSFTGTLPKGTPVAQCFPVSRMVPELHFETFAQEAAARYDATADALLSTPGIYRRRYRAHRSRPQRSVQPAKIEP